MARVAIDIPGYGKLDGEAPIVILGPNGSGKTQLAQKIARTHNVNAISAQRRTWIDDNLPVQEEQSLRSQTRSHQDRWSDCAWQPVEDINFVLSTLVQNHTDQLTRNNERAIDSGEAMPPVTDTKLMLLQSLWNRLFPKRKLEIGFFPKVKRLDGLAQEQPYHLRQMSDGERTILYMAARVLTAEHDSILVDEPELHMHCRLSVRFWDEAEKLRPDCRFLYVTHDLNFALSRRSATVLIARSNQAAELVVVAELPSSVAAEVLGAATLPFYARRIFLFEGEQGRGFASDFFSVWFDDDETFAIPSGGRDSVCAAVSGLRAVGVVAADIMGLVDRDFYSDEVLNEVTSGVTVLPLHEIESVLCVRDVVKALAAHFGKEPDATWQAFIDRVRKEFRAQELNNVVARRVRSRVGDLLDGAFTGAQIDADPLRTGENHQATLVNLDLPSKVGTMFAEERRRVSDALDLCGAEFLAILPGKHLLKLLGSVIGLRDHKELTNLVIRSLDRKRLKPEDPLGVLGEKIEAALLVYLPSRRA